MDKSIKTQMDIKNNAEEMQKFLLEMKNWEAEMKAQENKLKGTEPALERKNKDVPPPRNKKTLTPQSKSQSPAKLQQRISSYDYAKWDKFCGEIDSDEKELSSESDEDDLPPAFTKKESPVKPKEPSAKLPSQASYKKQAIEEVSSSSSKPLKTTGQPVDVVQKNNEGEEAVEKAILGSNKKDKTSLQDIDAAHFEKEMGNKYVKDEKWTDAIDCYSRAIELDPNNAIFRCNRAVCHLKLGNFKIAEVDATIAIQLDKTYPKAYLRRAHARKGLQQYEEAKADFQQLLLLEPSYISAKTEIATIDEHLRKIAENASKPKVKATFDAKKLFGAESKTNQDSKPDLVEPKAMSLVSVFQGDMPEGSIPVVPVEKAPHLRSKDPLRRIEVRQNEDPSSFDRLLKYSPNNATKTPNDVTPSVPAALPTIKPVSVEISKKSQSQTLPKVPVTYVQFENAWKSIEDNSVLQYQFLKSISCASLPSIFGSWLETTMFSNILAALSHEDCLSDVLLVRDFLEALTKVERFSSLVLFMSTEDEKAVERCLSVIQSSGDNEEYIHLQKSYNLS